MNVNYQQNGAGLHPAMDRQGSVLSTLSADDYDFLDFTQDDELTVIDGASPATQAATTESGVNFLHKNRGIFVKVSVRESHGLSTAGVLSSTRLYDLDCSHSGYKWRIVRKYSQFEELHRALRFFRTSIKLNKPIEGAASKPAPTVSSSLPEKRRRSVHGILREIGRGRANTLRFPSKPDMFVTSAAQIERRRGQLEEYINAVLTDPRYKTHISTMKFLEVSRLSFMKHSGEKYHEGQISKRSGGRRFPTFLSCFAPTSASWNKRWLVLKDSYICYLRPNQEIADVMLFDQEFNEMSVGRVSTGIRHGMVVTNTARELALKTASYHKTRNWAHAIEEVAERCEYIHSTPNGSFAPRRRELAHWYVDAVHYFEDVASALENAHEEIFITDWWLSPELFLKRPVVSMEDPSRLDKILKRKAEDGVMVYILLYKEIEMAVAGIQSMKCKNHLESLHPNIRVMRHPDHFKSSIYLWTHHEKIVCVDQSIAFVGGLDLCFGRWDNPEHRLTDLGSVQSITPPISRPASTSNPEDWKGIGSDDVNKHRKKDKSVKGSKKKVMITSQSHTTTITKLQPTFTLDENLAASALSADTRRRSFSDFSGRPVERFKNVVHKSMSLYLEQLPAIEQARSDVGRKEMSDSPTTQASTSSASEQEVFVVVQAASSEHLAVSSAGLDTVDGGLEATPILGDGSSPTSHDNSTNVVVSVAIEPPPTDGLRPELLTMKSVPGDSEHNSFSSEILSVPFKAANTPDSLGSTGFGDHHSSEQLGKEGENACDQSEAALLLEPITDLQLIAQRKKSTGKTPVPSSLYMQHVEEAISRSTVNLQKLKIKAKGRQKARTESMSTQPEQEPKRTSWKKIRNNLDKVRSVWRHEQALRGDSIHGSRKSSVASTIGTDYPTKFWVGKDYVNWIHKDLDNVTAPFNDSVDRFNTVRMPWHDIACVLFNKAATDVGRHFIQRWNHAKKVKASTKSSSKYPLLVPRSTNSTYKRLPAFIRESCDLVNCQILRSCSGWSSGMQKPEHSIYNAYITLIENSQHYIYIENQFFISWCGSEIENCICEALINRILKAHRSKQTFRVYIVLPLLPAFEADLDPQKSGGSPLFSVLHYVQKSLVGPENSLYAKLYSHGLDPNRYLSVCGLRTHGTLQTQLVTELIYVHSKLMIVDDRKCIIGSANINNRSLLGDRDSEIATLIEDELFIDSKMSGQDYLAGRFCYGLRNQLFREHLGLRGDEQVQDITCEQFYKNMWVTTAALNTNIYAKVFNCLPCDSVTSFEELRQCRQQTPLAASDKAAASAMLLKVKGHLVIYPLQFLKDEILINHLGAKETLVPNKFWT